MNDSAKKNPERQNLVHSCYEDEAKIFGLQKEIFWLGVVSFLTDVSSEMLFSVLTIFMTAILGASAAIIGLMEGLADFSASSLDYISGYLSDKTGKRKIFAIFGYGFSTLAKTILVFFNNIAGVFTFRIVERLGKSIRGAPRDALISTITEKEKIGYAFGFHKMMDKSGAILGPVLGYFVLTWFGQNLQTFQLLFVIAIVPAILSVIILGLTIQEKQTAAPKIRENIFKNYKLLGKNFHDYLKIAAFFSLSYFSFAFLLLKAYSVGFAINDVVLLYALFNTSFILVSIPAGKIGDKFGRKNIIIAEYLIYALMCAGLAIATMKFQIIILFIVYGIFYALDEAQTKAYISEITPTEHRGSAIGLYNFITGVGYLLASVFAGWLWNGYNSAIPFILASVIALASGLLLAFYKKEASEKTEKSDQKIHAKAPKNTLAAKILLGGGIFFMGSAFYFNQAINCKIISAAEKGVRQTDIQFCKFFNLYIPGYYMPYTKGGLMLFGDFFFSNVSLVLSILCFIIFGIILFTKKNDAQSHSR